MHLVDFDNIEKWKSLVSGDVLFSCMGTTLKVAGSKEAQWKIDYQYPLEFAKIARENGIKQQILVSSAMASPQSSMFYAKMKGSLEEAMKGLGFERLIVLRPPILIRRNSDRLGEKISVKVIQFLNSLGLFKAMKPMPTEFLAQRMMEVSLQSEKGVFTKEAEEIRAINSF